MKHDFVLNFTALDDQAFIQLVRRLDYAAAACYKIQDQKLVYFFGTPAPENEQWPATTVFDQSYYNAIRDRGLPLGWQKPKLSIERRKIWPKGIIGYYPEQESLPAKLVMFVIPRRKRAYVQGELDGPLEVVMKRVSTWVNENHNRHFINETLFAEHIRRLGLETQTLIDHELRTPLSIIDGFALQLENFRDDPDSVANFGEVIREQVSLGIQAVEKLGMVLKTNYERRFEKAELEAVDFGKVVRKVCQMLLDDPSAQSMQGKKPVFSVVEPRDAEPLWVSANLELIERALFEVMQNAVIHSQKGNIRLTIYRSEESAVLDIEDDGHGVPLGTEDLIFLRFFQGANVLKVRRGHRGMGLGLFMARHIAELHMGQLSFIRQANKGAIFRFIWPLLSASDQRTDGGLISPKKAG